MLFYEWYIIIVNGTNNDLVIYNMSVFDSFWARAFSFVKSVLATLKESLLWLLMTYFMPLLQFFIIWGIKQEGFQWCDIENLKIVLVANASIYTAALLVLGSKESKKTVKDSDNSVMKTFTIVAYGLTVVLFSFSMIEIYRNIPIFPAFVYKWGTLVTLLFAILLGIISNYNKVKARSLSIAEEGKHRTSVTINDTQFDL